MSAVYKVPSIVGVPKNVKKLWVVWAVVDPDHDGRETVYKVRVCTTEKGRDMAIAAAGSDYHGWLKRVDVAEYDLREPKITTVISKR